MPWYRSGTVACTLNSTVVVGSETAFSINARVGDAFQGPDGNWYEITEITGAGGLSIAPPYVGKTAKAGAYAIAPMQGYVKDSADQLRTITRQFGALAASTVINALAKTVPLEGKFPYFSSHTAMALAPLSDFARSGANADITSLTGLVAPLSTAQGGTSVTSIAALLTALNTVGNFSRANILGTVAQSRGVPTGAMIERGRNASGEYTKYADGTLMCVRRDGPFSLAASARANINALTWPATFVSMPYVTLGVQGSYPDQLHVGFEASSGVSASAFKYSISNRHASASVTDMYVMTMAFGRWF